jgi:MoxR-like ATPase
MSKKNNLIDFIQRDDEWDVTLSTARYFINNKRRNCVMLFSGPSGTGKSFIIDHLAKELGSEVTSTIGGDGLTRLDFEGKTDFNEKGTFFDYGIIPQAIKKTNRDGVHILKIEEFNMMPPDTQTSINSVLDRQAEICLIGNNGERVKVEDGNTLIIIITINEGYRGDFGIQESLKSRVDLHKDFHFGDDKTEAKIIQVNVTIPDELAHKIAKFGRELRRAYNKNDRSVDEEVTTRGLINIAHLSKAGLNPEQVVRYAVANKLSIHEDKRDLVVQIAEGQDLLKSIKNYQDRQNGVESKTKEEYDVEEVEFDLENEIDVKSMNELNVPLKVKDYETYEVNEMPLYIEYRGKEYPVTRKYQSYPEGQITARRLGTDNKINLVVKDPSTGNIRSESTKVKIIVK